jgi:HD-GYP domain-containing protein (c-di-GMP phosphodiesterase class II)
LALADALGIMDATQRESLEMGALLHDVGKIGVPDAILLKPGKLTDEEWQLMRQHPAIGYRILRDIPFLQRALAVVQYHHERWDGAGYPHRLKGDAIPLPARIFAVADTLDAITTNRPYRAAAPFAVARQEIVRLRGVQFDPRVVDAFATIRDETWQALAQQITGEHNIQA